MSEKKIEVMSEHEKLELIATDFVDELKPTTVYEGAKIYQFGGGKLSAVLMEFAGFLQNAELSVLRAEHAGLKEADNVKTIKIEVFSPDEKLPELNKEVIVWNDLGINYQAVYAGAKFLEPTGYEYAFILDFSVRNYFLPNEIKGWAYIPQYEG